MSSDPDYQPIYEVLNDIIVLPKLSTECNVCHKEKDLRILPCNDSMCFDCLNKAILQARLVDKLPNCVVCKAVLEHDAREYPACTTLTKQLKQEVENLYTVLENKSSLEALCQSGEKCSRPIDIYCRRCFQLYCYRYRCHKKSRCTSDDGEHDAVDYEEHLTECRKTFEMWQSGKKNKVIMLNHQRKDVLKEIHRAGLQIGEAPLTSLELILPRLIQELTAKEKQLHVVAREISDVEKVLAFYERHLSSLGDAQLVRVVQRLNINQGDQFFCSWNLGEFKSMSSKRCQYVYAAPDGHILVARSNGLDIYTDTSPHSIGSIDIGDVQALVNYKGFFYVINRYNDRFRATVYDHQFKEQRKWELRYYACDIAVNNDKVYITSDKYKIHVFSLYGQYLHDITTTEGVRLTSYAPDRLIVLDHCNDKVQMLNCATHEVIWEAEADKPWGVSIDDYDIIWVFLESEQCIYTYSVEGKQLQTIDHPDLINSTEVTAICVHNSKLWVTYESGCSRFQIGNG